MKELLLFYLPSCPHCKLALQCIETLKAENPQYAGVQIKLIDEGVEKKLANSYDYWYVPCFWLDGKKVYEGHMEKTDVKRVLDIAIQ
ncbi:MAG: thioredoxin family protein [Clostridia bacterium]